MSKSPILDLERHLLRAYASAEVVRASVVPEGLGRFASMKEDISKALKLTRLIERHCVDCKRWLWNPADGIDHEDICGP